MTPCGLHRVYRHTNKKTKKQKNESARNERYLAKIDNLSKIFEFNESSVLTFLTCHHMWYKTANDIPKTMPCIKHF